MRLSLAEAVLFALMVGVGEVYFLADGVRLGAGAAEIGLLAGLPLALGALGPLAALRLLARVGRRKPIVVAAAASQAVALFLLAGLNAGGALTPRILIAVACGYQFAAQAAGTAWSSWYGDLVPAAVRGRYFARRSRGAYVGTLVGLIGGGLVLTWLEPTRAGGAEAAGGLGYAVAYGFAGVFRCASVGLLASADEGRFSGTPDRARIVRFLRTGRGTGAWRVVLLVALLQVAVQTASPFFNPYMLKNLSFSYLEYTASASCLLVMKVLMMPLWGRSIDSRGARRTLVRGAILLAIVPLPWTLVSGLGGVILCQAASGIAWSGFEVGHFSLLLELSYRRLRPTVFAAQSIVSGVAQLVGSSIGGALLEAHLDPRALFAISGTARIGAALCLWRMLPGAAAVPGAHPILGMLGFRSWAGVAHRPLEEAHAGEPEERGAGD
jgi:MFS family permease